MVNFHRALVPMLLLLHAGMLAWIAARTSPTLDEVGHLPAGIYAWQFDRHDVYRVNPPLGRMVAGLPAYLAGVEMHWKQYADGPNARPEWNLGRELIETNDKGDGGWFRYFLWGRWACILFSLIGGTVCYCWAAELYGKPAGLTALLLWCFCPNVLAWGATICPDTAGAALGLTAGHAFWRWLIQPDWQRASLAGVGMGLALLSKTTWIILFALWPLLWSLYLIRPRSAAAESATGEHRSWRATGQLGFVFVIGLVVLNLGYTFEGSFQRLGDYTFVSRSLAGTDSVPDGGRGGNRFVDTPLAAIPIPVPKNFLRGIDLQKVDFEEGKESYLLGRWKHGGWWYYYLFVALLKIPIGTLLLTLLAFVVTLRCFRRYRSEPPEMPSLQSPGRAQGYCASWREEFAVLLPAICVFALVSSQTGFSRYFRYVLPALPFLFVWVSKVARLVDLGERRVAWLGGLCLLSSIISSSLVFPHSMSYFNALAGGPRGGHRYVIDANIDWGQDLWNLRRWLDAHPGAQPLHLGFLSFVHPRHFNIRYRTPPQGPHEGADYSQAEGEANAVGPLPGWYAMSVHRIYSSRDRYRYFLQFEPVATAGYSIYIYHITLDEANRVRRELGLPALTAEAAAEQ